MAKAGKNPPKRSIFWWIGAAPIIAIRWGLRILAIAIIMMVVWIALYAFVNPPTTAYIIKEGMRVGEIRREWRDYDDISPHMARAVVAAEDANFCNHWGFDMDAIRDALEDGSGRGASTISQQVVKNVFLWHGRSWFRKALEAAITPVMEMIWSKNRIVEVYMNVAEFDQGVFGVGAAAPWYFGVDARDLSETQASLLAAILPNPKERSAKRPSNLVQKRARSIRSGAATILFDGRSACFDG